jgi:pyrrolidone-carboxylate peptidase
LRILVCGFKGDTNSAKLLLDRIESKCIVEKLYLVNSFNTSKNQLENRLKSHEYDLIIAFGQKPNTKSIYLEEKARFNENEIKTDYDYNNLKKIFDSSGFTVEISNNAGNYLCNHIFYTGLQFIYENKLNTKMIFIHIPSIKNISNIDYVGKVFSLYLESSIL